MRRISDLNPKDTAVKRIIATTLILALPLGATAQPFAWTTGSADATLYLAKKDKHQHEDRDDNRRGKRLQQNHKINPVYGSKRPVRKRARTSKGLFFGGSFFKTGLFFQ